MEFQRERVYTALNADELKPGDKVIVAYSIYQLKEQVKMFTESVVNEIETIYDECYCNRFKVIHGENYPLPLVYLVKRKENCTNCELRYRPECNKSKWPEQEVKVFRCSDYKSKTEQKVEKQYRPFRDVDELIKVWEKKWSEKTNGQKWHDCNLNMPHIWVRLKECNKGGLLITYFGEDEVKTDAGFLTMSKLLNAYTFTDGSVCGVEV